VRGQTRTEAERTLSAAGFRLDARTAEPTQGRGRTEPGTAWRQSPAPGTQAPKGSTVTVWFAP
jgi:beta-lactam-binding protein with PASTA domain